MKKYNKIYYIPKSKMARPCRKDVKRKKLQEFINGNHLPLEE
jgi:hypothetical protein